VANYAYGLYAIMHNGKKVKLLDQMNLETQLYLEQEIERFLRIKDKAIRGEVKKS
jgi:Fe-S cluster biosynthesis and repair protein YggX